MTIPKYNKMNEVSEIDLRMYREELALWDRLAPNAQTGFKGGGTIVTKSPGRAAHIRQRMYRIRKKFILAHGSSPWDDLILTIDGHLITASLRDLGVLEIIGDPNYSHPAPTVLAPLTSEPEPEPVLSDEVQKSLEHMRRQALFKKDEPLF